MTMRSVLYPALALAAAAAAAGMAVPSFEPDVDFEGLDGVGPVPSVAPLAGEVFPSFAPAPAFEVLADGAPAVSAAPFLSDVLDAVASPEVDEFAVLPSVEASPDALEAGFTPLPFVEDDGFALSEPFGEGVSTSEEVEVAFSAEPEPIAQPFVSANGAAFAPRSDLVQDSAFEAPEPTAGFAVDEDLTLFSSPFPEMIVSTAAAGVASKDNMPKEATGKKTCYMQSVDFGAGTGQRCCEEHYKCDSAECADSVACRSNPDACSCRMTKCRKVYLYLSEKPMGALDASCTKDVYAL